MNRQRLVAWLRLTRTPGLGPVRIQQLLAAFGDPEQILKASLVHLRSVPGIGPKLAELLVHKAPVAVAQQELERMEALGIRMMTIGDDDYPAQLKTLHDPPAILFLQGRAELLSHPRLVAVVGSRHPSSRGRHFARMMARELADQGVGVVSGMAEGIDAAAHWGALEVQGMTVGVMATGLDVDYPRPHGPLRQRVRQTGCLLSEAPLGTQPAPHLFPSRNRIISGLCQGVLVVEATLSSGSLITARVAMEQGREVFAVPGPADDPRSQGPHSLLKDGATLVERPRDLLEALDWCHAGVGGNPAPPTEPAGQMAQVLACLHEGPRSCDDLLRHCQLTVGELSRILLQLELAGAVARSPGDMVELTLLPSERRPYS